jgi:hypothetical protein
MTIANAKPTTCVYAARHGCGDREAHPYMIGGGYACDLHKPGAGVPLAPDTRSQVRIAQAPGATVVDWPSSQTGPCALCGGPCRRYGVGGNPLCARCRPADRRAEPRDDDFAHDALKNAA